MNVQRLMNDEEAEAERRRGGASASRGPAQFVSPVQAWGTHSGDSEDSSAGN
jgi:hypothetical protein